MRASSRLAFSCVVVMLLAGPAAAGVKVSFADPKRLADADLRGVDVVKDLRTYFQRLSSRLDRGIDLNVTVLDIDATGFDMSTRGPSSYRVLSGATWPKIKLRYALTKNGKVIASGEEWVTDQIYRAHAGMASSSDPLRYEKNMLDDWFSARFASHMRAASR
jgi:Protein of unknown function (DUF3016)